LGGDALQPLALEGRLGAATRLTPPAAPRFHLGGPGEE
jgi:hypothetical protein